MPYINTGIPVERIGLCQQSASLPCLYACVQVTARSSICILI